MIIKVSVVAILALGLYYVFLDWKYKRDLIKLREGYNEDSDTNRKPEC